MGSQTARPSKALHRTLISHYSNSVTHHRILFSLALIDDFLYATGLLIANDVSMSAAGGPTKGLNQVWGTRTERVSPWSWIYTYEASNLDQISVSVKHSSLQIRQNVMLLNSKDAGILVLPFWGLSPRETPDKNISSWRAPVTELQSMTHLSSNGGVYGISSSGDLLWVPIIQPYSLVVPPSFGPTLPPSGSLSSAGPMGYTSLPSFNQLATRTMDVSGAYPTSQSSPGAIPAQYVTHKIGNLTNLLSVWLAHDAYTLYAMTEEGGGSTLYSMLTSPGPQVNFNSTPILTTGQRASSFLVHPKTRDVFLVVPGSGVFVYDSNGALKGQVNTTFSNPRALEMDNDGKTLWIGGDHEGKRARLDKLDLERNHLSSSLPLKSPSFIRLTLITLGYALWATIS